MFESLIEAGTTNAEKWPATRKAALYVPPIFSLCCLALFLIGVKLNLTGLQQVLVLIWVSGSIAIAMILSMKCIQIGRIVAALLVWLYSFALVWATVLLAFVLIVSIFGMS